MKEIKKEKLPQSTRVLYFTLVAMLLLQLYVGTPLMINVPNGKFTLLLLIR
jgi:hypothetical protein